MLNVLARLIHPVPSRVELVGAMRTASNAATARGADVLRAFYGTIRIRLRRDRSAPGVSARTYAVCRMAGLPGVPAGRERFDVQVANQQALVDRYRFVSLAVVTHGVLADLAGTGMARYRAWREQVDWYHAAAGLLPAEFSRGELLTAADYPAILQFGCGAGRSGRRDAGWRRKPGHRNAGGAAVAGRGMAAPADRGGRMSGFARATLTTVLAVSAPLRAPALDYALTPVPSPWAASPGVPCHRAHPDRRHLDEAAWLVAPGGDGSGRSIRQDAPATVDTEVRPRRRALVRRRHPAGSGGCRWRSRRLSTDFAFENDLFGITLDPFLDRRNSVSFQTNLYGVQRDLLASDGMSFDRDWPVWQVRTTVGDWDGPRNSAIPWTISVSVGGGPLGAQPFALRATNEQSGWSPWPRGFNNTTR
ncbi:MAG: DUF3526 domain-containing protein [Gemmatimonadales bacterium]